MGTSSTAANSLIILVFLISATLRCRKELLLLVGLAVADLIYSLGVIVKGHRRHFGNVYRIQIPRLECWQRFESILTIFGAQISPLMTLCISIDRLIAIKWYNLYKRFPRGFYVLCTIGSAFSCVTTLFLQIIPSIQIIFILRSCSYSCSCSRPVRVYGCTILRPYRR